jgi:hypothetical protein
VAHVAKARVLAARASDYAFLQDFALILQVLQEWFIIGIAVLEEFNEFLYRLFD